MTGDAAALNSAKPMSETRTLFLAGFGQGHDALCPMYRVFKGDEGSTTSGTRKAAGSKRLNYRDFLPVDELETTIKAPGKSPGTGDDRTRRKRRPRLARLLLTLIEDAGLNKISPISPLPAHAARISIKAIEDAASEVEYVIADWPVNRVSELLPWRVTLPAE